MTEEFHTGDTVLITRLKGGVRGIICYKSWSLTMNGTGYVYKFISTGDVLYEGIAIVPVRLVLTEKNMGNRFYFDNENPCREIQIR